MKFLFLLGFVSVAAIAADYGDRDRTVADDRNAKIESLQIHTTSGSASSKVHWWNSERWDVQGDWKDRVDETEVAYLKDLTLNLKVSIPHPTLDGPRVADLRVVTRLGAFHSEDDPFLLYTSTPMGVTLERMGYRMEGRFKHVLYRMTIPYREGEKSVDVKLVFPSVSVEQTVRKGIIREEIGSTVKIEFRRNQQSPTDVFGGGPAHRENLLGTLVVK